jgi:hypothetical protein
VIPAGDADERVDARAARQRRERILRAGTHRHAADRAAADTGQARKEIRGRHDIGDLARRHLELARRTAALAETREVEAEGGVAERGETLRVHLGHLFLHREPGADDDHGGLRVDEVVDIAMEHRGERRALAREYERRADDLHGLAPVFVAGEDWQRIERLGGPILAFRASSCGREIDHARRSEGKKPVCARSCRRK